MEDLNIICRKVIDLVRETGNFLKEHHGSIREEEIETKSLNSLVSYADKQAEKRLVKGLKDILPESVFLTEEETIKTGEGFMQWIIDPLDGTTNYLHGIPLYSISVALKKEEKIVLGVVFNVTGKECFYAWNLGGAYLNGNPIKVSKAQKLQDSLVATGFPYHDFSKTDAYLKVLKHFMFGTRGVRRLGSAAIDLAYVACGRFDAFYEYGLNAWDVSAGAILIEEAGGRITDFSLGTKHLTGEEIEK